MSATQQSQRKMEYRRRRWQSMTEAQKAEVIEKQRRYQAEYHTKNRERRLRRGAAYYKANQEHAKQQAALARDVIKADPHKLEQHKQKRQSRGIVYREANREKLREQGVAYYKGHKAESFARVQKRNALKKAATINMQGIIAFVRSIKAKPLATCYYCQERVSTRTIHFDHIIALSKGGLHAVENLCVSCGPCNLSKGAKSLIEWAAYRGAQQLLNL